MGSNKRRRLLSEDESARSDAIGSPAVDAMKENSMPTCVETLFSPEEKLSNYPDIHGAVSGDASSAPYITQASIYLIRRTASCNRHLSHYPKILGQLASNQISTLSPKLIVYPSLVPWAVMRALTQ